MPLMAFCSAAERPIGIRTPENSETPTRPMPRCPSDRTRRAESHQIAQGERELDPSLDERSAALSGTIGDESLGVSAEKVGRDAQKRCGLDRHREPGPPVHQAHGAQRGQRHPIVADVSRGETNGMIPSMPAVSSAPAP